MTEDFRNKYPVWDRLLLFLYPCDESVTNEEVDKDLKRLSINMKPAFQRLHKMVETQRARSELAAAKERRASISDRVRDVVAPKFEDLRDGIRSMIGRLKGDQTQLAYFHKLEDAATEEDLQSLLDDLEKLEVMKEFRDD